MDISDLMVQLCEVDARGVVTFEGKVGATEKALTTFFEGRSYFRVAMEAGTHSLWMSGLLDSLGHTVIVADARKLAAISSSVRKNDRNDAAMLARLARADLKLLQPVEHRSVAAQTLLARLRARDALVRARTLLANTARGLVKPFGFRLPRCSPDVLPARCETGVPAELTPTIAPLLSQMAALTDAVRAIDDALEVIADEEYPQTQLLRQVKGVGPVTSLAFVLTIDDPKRFEQLRDVAAWVGLCPKQDQSGSVDRQLRISKAGDRYMRRLLVGSAQYILGPFGPDTDLRRWGLKLAERGGKGAKRRAAVAVARKLAVVLLSLWRSAEVYQPLKAEAIPPRRALHPRRSMTATSPRTRST
jgi:transposase